MVYLKAEDIFDGKYTSYPNISEDYFDDIKKSVLT